MPQFYLGSSNATTTFLGNIPINQVDQPDFLVATGGTITYDGDFKIHTFTNTGSFNFEVLQTSSISARNSVEYLIVAGGGGGGAAQDVGGTQERAGGGGAGGLLTSTYTVPSPGIYTGSVGDGGIGGSYEVPASVLATNGENSELFGLVAIGGGNGSGQAEYLGIGGCYPAGEGGSGGGAWTEGFDVCSIVGTSTPGISGQGNAGGANLTGGFNSGGGGGGGASAAGADAVSSAGGNGGDGVQSSISGTPTYYAGGGAGGGNASTGGLGGGGDSSLVGDPNATSNTGGGGGSGNEGVGGIGGSGIIIVKYRWRQDIY
jgi:hypothetical protein